MFVRPLSALAALAVALATATFVEEETPDSPRPPAVTIPGFPLRLPEAGEFEHGEGEVERRRTERGEVWEDRDHERDEIERSNEEADEHEQEIGPAIERWLRRVGPSGRTPPAALTRANEQRKRLPHFGTGGQFESAGGIDSTSWTFLGPNNVGGRLRGIEINPNNPDIMYVGGAGGGVFKSVNGGSSWFPLNDFLAAMTVGCMRMDPSDPATIYVGTGETRGTGTTGEGILVTHNSGNTWIQMPSTVGWQFVNEITIAHDDPDHLVVATDDGIQLTTNGGVTWTQTLAGRMRDVQFHPTDSTNLVAGDNVGTVHRSTDGGSTWTAELTTTGNMMNVEFARSDPTIVWATAASEDELWRGENGVWAKTHSGTMGIGVDGYYNAFWVDPADADHVIVGAVDLYRGVYSGGTTTFSKISAWGKAPASPHADHHVVTTHPDYDGINNKTVYFGTDGGIYRTQDVDTVGSDSDYTFGWQALNQGLGITQFYHAASDPTGQLVWGGTQDNGTLMFDGQVGWWAEIIGGDGFGCADDPRDRDVMYYEVTFGELRQSRDGGASSVKIEDFKNIDGAPFDTPYALDPNDYDRMFVASNSVWRCDDLTVADPVFTSISGAINKGSDIVVKDGNPDEVWVSDSKGDVWVSFDATTVSPTFTKVDGNGANPLPNRDCTAIAINPFTGDVYFGFSQYVDQNLWVTPNGGLGYINLGGGVLPELPINDICFHPTIPGTMYLATDLGLYASTDHGVTWSTTNDGPSNVAIDDLWWACGQLFAATHGRGIWVARTDATIVVPDDFPTIQAAIDAASSSDCNVVEVRPGYYNENLRLKGKAITVRSLGGAHQTIVDGTVNGFATVRFVDGETNSTVLEGFTLIGRTHDGVVISGSSPILRDCRIVGGHVTTQGGGLRIQNLSAPIVERCEILANRTSSSGGGISVTDSEATFANCAIAGNEGGALGGGLYADNSTVEIILCSFAENSAGDGTSVYAANSSTITAVNSIFWSRGGPEIADDGSASITVDSCDVRGGWGGAGSNNLAANPLFADPDHYELRLLPGSPCLDAGNNDLLDKTQDLDLRGQQRLADSDRLGGKFVNMGAHESVPIDATTMASVQAAIDAADPALGVVEIPAGTYFENLNLKGKRILLIGTAGAGQTILDGGASGPVIRCASSEAVDTVVAGLTLRNGSGTVGGGVSCISGAAPTIRDCIIEDNVTTAYGGGVYVGTGSAPTLVRCVVRNNTAASGGGGGLYFFGDGTLEQCLIHGNVNAGSSGVGVGGGAEVQMTNCTLTDHVVGMAVAGDLTLRNTIAKGNTTNLSVTGGSVTATYCNVGASGPLPGTGNINANPQFVNAPGGDYSLSSGSPCVDAGSNFDLSFLVQEDLAGNHRFCDVAAVADTGLTDTLRDVVDMGAYEAGNGVWTNLGRALAGQAGVKPRLTGTGPDCDTGIATVEVSQGLPLATGTLFLSATMNPLPYLGGTMVPSPLATLVAFTLDASGKASLTDVLDLNLGAQPQGAMDRQAMIPGVDDPEIYLQAWIVDPSGPQGYSASNALSFRIP